MTDDLFDKLFRTLTGHVPFPWQRALFHRFMKGDIPDACDIPTGLGKTAVIAIWLLALSEKTEDATLKDFPRRLVYVVNRRTVVDQATREVEQLRARLIDKVALRPVADALRYLCALETESPLAISTLRGQFADNAEWRHDPARPAVIVGTVDMIGSRLLFSGYRCGYRTRPLHAGLLGQDALIVHDEAHLEPAFQELISTVALRQRRDGDSLPIKVLALTATSRGTAKSELMLTGEDMDHRLAKLRLLARKGMIFHDIADKKELPEEVARLALAHRNSNQSIIVFLRTIDHIEKVQHTLTKEGQKTQVLTGTLRGWERDKLAAEDPVFQRFQHDGDIAPAAGTVYLLCTSAGEVGVNLSADHMICDITPFDSMAQRLGRVNRFGAGDARVDVVCPPKEDKPKPYDAAREATRDLLKDLPVRDDRLLDASPSGLSTLPEDARQAAFTPSPEILPTTDILLDGWSCTTIREPLPGRPPVADWLHGVAEWEPPLTQVAWREEVGVLTDALAALHPPEDLLDDFPLLPHELLADRSKRVFKHLKTLAKEHPGTEVWRLGPGDTLEQLLLSALTEGNDTAIQGCTILLPTAIGGLKAGLLNGGATGDKSAPDLDISDVLELPDGGGPLRQRCRGNERPAPGMRLVRTLDLREGDLDEGDEVEPARQWRWYARPRSFDDRGSLASKTPTLLQTHVNETERHARNLAEHLGLSPIHTEALATAARWHDTGKARALWQRAVKNNEFPGRVLAKSVSSNGFLDLGGYRHELGSLLDLLDTKELDDLAPEARELALHMIATHHGRGRPYFPDRERFDPDHPTSVTDPMTEEIPIRFFRLQRRYGRWGLAWLESLLRAADIMASREVEQ